MTCALVAEGTGVLGAAVVEQLTSEGGKVAFGGRNEERRRALVASTGALPLDPGGPDALVAAATARLGGLDALIVASGDAPSSRLSETSDEAWDELLESHLLEPWRLIVASQAELERKQGAIVVIASAVEEWPSARLGAHSVAIHGLAGLSRMLAAELAPRGVRVNTLCPEEVAAPAPPLRGRIGAPQDVAASVAFLLSSEARGCTGMCLLLDGGRRASLTAGAAVAT